MAGISSGFLDNPQYQRTIQKIMAMTPDQRAILDTSLATEQFAGEAMRQRVIGLRDAADEVERNRQLELRGRFLGLRERELESELSQAPTLRNIGIGQVVSAGLFGLADIFQSQQRVKTIGKESSLLRGISNRLGG